MTTSQAPIMHGGAERLPIRWVNAPTPPTVISRYRVAPGESVTLHVHTGKAENWVIVAGSGVVQVGEKTFAVADGCIVRTPPTVPHGLTNTGDVALVFLNIVEPTGDAPITSVELEV